LAFAPDLLSQPGFSGASVSVSRISPRNRRLPQLFRDIGPFSFPV